MVETTRGFISYTPDNGGQVTIKADAFTAGANSQSLSRTPTQVNGWPFHKNDMRHVVGISNSGSRTTMTICTPTLFAGIVPGTTTFTTHTDVYTVQSKKAERDNLRNLK